ncbi:LIM and senescent cell antigen-like-containing domain protein 1 [Diaphorina citri]|uniref:LIM and senescent cell antigen-like-containing domain protein 1 n=1 Tax=Diaphorina citri TaxID=121845 RepID=A0A3Q0IJL4_DIACI|nr:LIM and senescent cell antigen-like-containing domain protein 1 [Diaphorina citri]
MSLGNMYCSRCNEGFEPEEKIVNSNGELWHQQCFVCAQCFRPFPGGIFYEFEGRKYCEHDFHVLFAPCCGKCGEFVIGRVIKAMNANWHPKCFRCEHCSKELADLGFIRSQGRALCHECNAQAKAVGFGKHMCHKCHGLIDDKPLKFRGEVYHPYHFNCTSCGTELNSDAREVKSRPGYTANDMNELYCLRCHDKMGIPICGACRRPIEERVVTALGKHWHVEHFVCARCEKPFLGHRHYEKKGLAYCETHYHQLFGNLCFVCNQVIGGDVFTALNKAWCVHHFACSTLGKHWHVEHFVCARCEKPFLGHRHYEKKGLAYCETHYHQLFGNLCFVCNQVIGGDAVLSSDSSVFGLRHYEKKGLAYCETHYHQLFGNLCFVCNQVIGGDGKLNIISLLSDSSVFGLRHYEKNGLAYCETHYHQLFGNLCFVCNQVIGGDRKLSCV